MGNDDKFEALLTERLLLEGLLSREDLTAVLNFQSRLAGSQAMDFEEALVAMEYFPESELIRVKSELLAQYSTPSDNAKDLEQINKFFETELEDRPPTSKKPSASPPAPAEHEQYTPSFPGEHKVPQNLSSLESPSPLPSPGAIPQLTPELMAMLGDTEPSDTPRLGEILLENNDLEEWQLVHALCVQRAAPVKPRLGTLLVQLGYSEHQAVKRALTKQIKLR